MHEEMHADTEREQHHQQPVSSEEVDAMFVGQQQTRDSGEGDKDPAGARYPKAAGER
jgi:hypothetical protein